MSELNGRGKWRSDTGLSIRYKEENESVCVGRVGRAGF